MTSRTFHLLAPLFALAVAACGSGAQSAASTTPVDPTAPTAPTPPTAAAPDGAAAAAAPAAHPMAPGPNLTPGGVVFVFKPDGGGKGKKVFLAGNFNDWNKEDPKYLMTDDGTGTYRITIKLLPGAYQYKYVADGTWTKDPYSPSDAPDGFGGRNGKFEVK